jgi:DNA invertase Pin-like site-specific DNA recombinase
MAGARIFQRARRGPWPKRHQSASRSQTSHSPLEIRAGLHPAAGRRPAGLGPPRAGVRRDDLYIDRGASGARASRPKFDKAVTALENGDTLVITILDRLGRSTQNMLAFAEMLRDRGAGLRMLNLGGGEMDTHTPMGSMVFTVMAALAQMELEIKRERITDSVAKRRPAGQDLGGRPRTFTDSQIRSAARLVDSGRPAAQVARDLGMSRATLYRRIRALPAAT